MRRAAQGTEAMMDRTKARMRAGLALLLGAVALSGCVYAPPPAAYGPAPGYAYSPAPAYYYPAPAYYYPPVVGSVFVGGRFHFR